MRRVQWHQLYQALQVWLITAMAPSVSCLVMRATSFSKRFRQSIRGPSWWASFLGPQDEKKDLTTTIVVSEPQVGVLAMWLFNLLFNLACVEDINRQPTDFPDNKAADFDGDGLSELQGDCNDLDETVLQASTWYADADADGFGDPNVQEACEQPEGYVENSEDCLDTDNTVYPGNAV